MELEYLGWNMLTLSFLATLFFSLLGGWGLFHQNQKIWKNQSGEAVPSIWYICSLGLFCSSVSYGITIQSIALVFSGVLRGFLHIPILIGLWKFKGFSVFEKRLSFFLFLVVLVMLALPWKGVFFVGCCFATIIPTATQPLEIWRKKSIGVVSLPVIATAFASSFFWVIYGHYVDDLPIFIVSIAFTVILFLTIVLWFWYRKTSSSA